METANPVHLAPTVRFGTELLASLYHAPSDIIGMDRLVQFKLKTVLLELIGVDFLVSLSLINARLVPFGMEIYVILTVVNVLQDHTGMGCLVLSSLVNALQLCIGSMGNAYQLETIVLQELTSMGKHAFLHLLVLEDGYGIKI